MNKTFRFFISSPFGDFKKERDVLHNKVFPKIREYCKEQDFVFQPIDLRWGITESASIDQKTLDICLEEVQISKQYPQPNFLIMAGDRYGSILLPSMIEKEELESLKKYVIDKDFIDIWYKLDENQIPVSYVLQPRLNSENSHDKIDYTNRDNWKPINELLLNILQSASQEAFENEKITEEQKEKYFTSATEAEVIEGIYEFKSITPFQEKNKKLIEEKYIYGYTRTFFEKVEKINVSDEQLKQYFDINKDDNIVNKDAFEKAKAFKDEIKKILNENVLKKDYKNDLDKYEKDELKEFEEFIIDKLESAIDDEAERIKNFKKDNNIESIEQEKFLKLKYKNFQGRTATLDQITDFIDNTDINLLVLHGPSGAGKSSLMAAAINTNLLYDLTNKNLLSKEGYQLVYRFVGATEKTTNIFNLLKSILDEFQEKNIIEDIKNYEIEEHKFFKQANDIFSKLYSNEKILIFIDALDQLDGQVNFSWLPEKLLPNLKIVLSLLNDKDYEDSIYYENIKHRDNLQYIDIKKDIFDEKDSKILLKNLLADEKRKIQNDQETEILKQWKKTDYSPLYIKIAIEKIKHWKSYEKNLTLEDDLEELTKNYINNLKEDFHLNHEIVDKVFGYVYASKDGLSESELLDILSEDLTDDEKMQDAIIGDRYEAITTNESRRDKEKEYILPISLWSRLHFQLKPFIIERSIDNQPLMKFFHRQFDKVIKDYFGEEIHQKNHGRLANYFYLLQHKDKTWEKRYYSLRMLSELPYQLFQSKNSEKLKHILFDLEFAGSIYNNSKQDSFRSIMSKASSLKSISDDEIYPWESFYREKEHLILKVNDEMWKPHQTLFQLANEDGSNSIISYYSKYLLEKKRIKWSFLRKKHLTNMKRFNFEIFSVGSPKIIKDNIIIIQNKNILSCYFKRKKILEIKFDLFEKIDDSKFLIKFKNRIYVYSIVSDKIIKSFEEEIEYEISNISIINSNILSMLINNDLYLFGLENYQFNKILQKINYYSIKLIDKYLIIYVSNYETENSETFLYDISLKSLVNNSYIDTEILNADIIDEYFFKEIYVYLIELEDFKGNKLFINNGTDVKVKENLHQSYYRIIEFNNYLITYSVGASEKCEIIVHDEFFNEIKRLPVGSHNAYVENIFIYGDYFISIGADSKIIVWNNNLEEINRINTETYIEDAIFNNNNIFCSHGLKNEYKTYIYSDLLNSNNESSHDDLIHDGMFLNNSEYITISRDGYCKIWANNGSLNNKFRYSNSVYSNFNIFNFDTAISIISDDSVQLYDQNGSCLAKIDMTEFNNWGIPKFKFKFPYIFLFELNILITLRSNSQYNIMSIDDCTKNDEKLYFETEYVDDDNFDDFVNIKPNNLIKNYDINIDEKVLKIKFKKNTMNYVLSSHTNGYITNEREILLWDGKDVSLYDIKK